YERRSGTDEEQRHQICHIAEQEGERIIQRTTDLAAVPAEVEDEGEKGASGQQPEPDRVTASLVEVGEAETDVPQRSHRSAERLLPLRFAAGLPRGHGPAGPLGD